MYFEAMKTNETNKSKLDRVADAVEFEAGRQMTKFQCAEVAQQLLRRHGGNLFAALADARAPFRVGGRVSW